MYSQKIEGIMVVIQELSVKDGFTVDVTKDYMIKKLTELSLTQYIDAVLDQYGEFLK